MQALKTCVPESGFIGRPAEGAVAIRCLLKIGILKMSGHFGIPEAPMPELEGISN